MRSVYVPAEKRSIYFPSTVDSWMADTTASAVTIQNAWTIAIWAKPSSNYSSLHYVFTVQHEQSNDFPIAFPFSNIDITFGSSNSMRVQTWAGLAAPLKDYTYNNWYTANAWVHTVITWDGTSLLAYKNGVLTTADTMTTDAAGSMGQPSRKIAIGTAADVGIGAGQAFQGTIYSVTLWGIVLVQQDVNILYNGGYGEKIQLDTFYPGYANFLTPFWVVHHWRCGHYFPPTSGIGRDYSGGFWSASRRNMMNNSSAITEANIVHDFPGKDL